MTSTYSNITQAELLTHFSGYNNFFRYRTRKYHFPEYNELFKSEVFVLFEFGKLLLENLIKKASFPEK